MSKRKPAATTALSAAQLASLAETVLGPIRARKALYESSRFKTLMQTFRDVVSRDGTIDQESMKYAKPGAYPFTADAFQKAVEAVMEHAPGEEKTRRTKTGSFPVIYKRYEGLEFSVMIGQGSSYSISADKKASPRP